MVLMGWMLFRIEDMGQLSEVLRGMLSLNGGTAAYLAGHHDALYPLFLLIPACIGCLPVGAWLKKKLPCNRLMDGLGAMVDVAVFALCVFMLLGSTYNPFIYFRF